MIRQRLGRLLVLVFATLANSALAAEPPPTHQPSQKWALLIGVNDYAYINKLKYCGADMEALRGRLVEAGFPENHVYLLSDNAKDKKYQPFKNNIETQIDLVTKLVGKDDVLVLAFAGHGVHINDVDYVCPVDARLDDTKNSLVSLDSVYERVRKSPAALKIMLVDACRDDPTPGGKRSAADTAEENRKFAKRLEKTPQGIVLLNSCSPGESSMEDAKLSHGVFTYFLLEGLAGKADTNGDGVVTLSELAEYVGDQTKNHVASKWASLQRPYLKGDLSLDAMRFDIGRIGPKAIPKTPVNSVDRTIGQGTKVGQERDDNSLNMPLIWCSKGSFKMGDGGDAVPVTLSHGFWLGKTSVTQAQWEAVMGTKPWIDKPVTKTGSDYPASWVSAIDADEFHDKLNERERRAGRLPIGWVYALPTEAEREYATRAGTTTRYSFGDDAAKLHEYAWYGGLDRGGIKGEDYAHRVAQKKPNPWGFYDLHGGIWEWCRDSGGAYPLPGGTDPFAFVAKNGNRMFRGGSWQMFDTCATSFERREDPAWNADAYYGFRTALVPEGTVKIHVLKGEGRAAGQSRNDNSLNLALGWCPADSFKMGDGKEAVQVTLTRGFWLGQTAITQGQWKAVMGSEPWKGKEFVIEGNDVAASWISALDADEFVKKFNERERAAKRLQDGWVYALPTDAQREYATRAGTTTRYSFGDDSKELFDHAWYGGFKRGEPMKDEDYAHPVAKKKANPWGLYDVHGGIWEWCRDNDEGNPPGGTDPYVYKTDGKGGRIFRGGCWNMWAVNCTSSERRGDPADSKDPFLGFRIALVAANSVKDAQAGR